MNKRSDISFYFYYSFIHANMGARLTLKLIIIYTYIWFYYFRLCYNFNKSSKVNLVKFQNKCKIIVKCRQQGLLLLLDNSDTNWLNFEYVEWLFILRDAVPHSLPFHIRVIGSCQSVCQVHWLTLLYEFLCLENTHLSNTLYFDELKSVMTPLGIQL